MLVTGTIDQSKVLPIVNVAKVQISPNKSELVLPGNIEPVTEAPVLARATGYVKARYVDIGDRVTAGQLLAELEAPELDHQVAQAKSAIDQAGSALEQANANLQQARANEKLYETTSQRYHNLVGRGAVSRQEADNFEAQFEAQQSSVVALEKAVNVAKSSVTGATQNLARLTDLQGYQKVKAPFAGIITTRNVDVGALVNEGSTLLYRIAQTERLRTYINVPQTDANSVHIGMQAGITLPDMPARVFPGTVTRTANSLDPSSRTLLAEVQLDNRSGVLMPGMYAQVNFETARSQPPMLIPDEAMVIRADGPKVARVMPDHTVHFQYIQLGRDYGETVEVISGVQPGDELVINPGDRVQEGVKVNPVFPSAAAGRAGGKKK
jgi:RND family efflux transporter MFP subunit